MINESVGLGDTQNFTIFLTMIWLISCYGFLFRLTYHWWHYIFFFINLLTSQISNCEIYFFVFVYYIYTPNGDSVKLKWLLFCYRNNNKGGRCIFFNNNYLCFQTFLRNLSAAVSVNGSESLVRLKQFCMSGTWIWRTVLILRTYNLWP